MDRILEVIFTIALILLLAGLLVYFLLFLAAAIGLFA